MTYMTKIAVFDSGLGSLSVITAIKKYSKCEIIYFADLANFPYGLKAANQLHRIITKTIKLLQEKFNPNLIVIGSNTPTLLFPEITSTKVIGVTPPLRDAIKITRTDNIAILATKATVGSKELEHFIKSQNLRSKKRKANIHKINSSKLVRLVESGKFLEDTKYCKRIIRQVLQEPLNKNNVDVATLSSTHLPFLREQLEQEFPDVTFLDPAVSIAKKISKMISDNPEIKSTLRIFTSGDPEKFQEKLQKIGIKGKVSFLSSYHE